MDKYDDVAIGGLVARVADLEAANGRMAATLQKISTCCDAAADHGHVWADTVIRIGRIADAALSDEGRLEVREQQIELLRRAERIIGLELEPAPACKQPHGKLSGAALEVVDWLATARAALEVT